MRKISLTDVTGNAIKVGKEKNHYFETKTSAQITMQCPWEECLEFYLKHF